MLNNWFDDTDWERDSYEYVAPYIVILPDNKLKIMPQNKINIQYKDLDKLKVKDIEKDALYFIKTANSEYCDVKTGMDLIRIIEQSNSLFVNSRLKALDKIKQSKANLFDFEDGLGY